MLGGGVNNETQVADKSNEHHFISGSGIVFGRGLGNLAIASYGIKGPEGDIGMMAEEYRLKGVDKKITEDDLRNTNMLSLISGSTYTFARSVHVKTNAKTTAKNGWCVLVFWLQKWL
jgi:hypothetical protein